MTASLPEVLEEASRGNLSRDFAADKLSQYLLSLFRLERDFRASLRLQVPEIADLCRPQAQCLERLFGLLQSTVEEARQAAAQALPGLADRIRCLTHDFNRAAADYREASLVAIGPTGLAGVNLVARTAQTLLDDGPDEVLNSQLNTQVQQELDRLELARRQSGEQLEVVLAQLELALHQLLRHFLPNLSEQAENALGYFLDCADMFEAQVRQLEKSQDLCHGATAYGEINRLVNTAEQVWGGDLSELEHLRRQLQANLATWRVQLQASSSRLEQSAQLTAGLAVCYQSFSDCLDSFCDAVAIGNRTEFGRLSQLLPSRWEDVLAAQRLLEDWLQQQNRRSCPCCAQSNGQTASRCVACGAMLVETPSMESPAPSLSQGELTENLKRLFTAVDAFTQGRLELEQLQQEVSRLSSRLGEVSNAPGYEDLAAGLGFLGQLSHPGQTDLAQMGARLVWEGSTRLQTGKLRAA